MSSTVPSQCCRCRSSLPQALFALTLISALLGCETESRSPAGEPTRETLLNGAVLVRYPDLPATDSVGPEVAEAQVDLQFGSVDGTDPNLTFGMSVTDSTPDVPVGFLPLHFQPFEMIRVNPAGGFWRAHNTSYRIARTGEDGDTLTVIEVGLNKALPSRSK